MYTKEVHIPQEGTQDDLLRFEKNNLECQFTFSTHPLKTSMSCMFYLKYSPYIWKLLTKNIDI